MRFRLHSLGVFRYNENMLRLFKSGFDFVKKAFLVITAFSLILTLFGNIIVGNRPKINEKAILAAKQEAMYKAVDDKQIGATKIEKAALFIYKLTFCSLVGEFCTNKPVAGNEYFKSSLLGKASSLISLPYKYAPASGTYWVTNTLQKAGIVPQSFAAEGIGFSSIKPLMNLWTIFRDVAYLLIVLVLVAIGFMIMFRMKLNPQTVISVENSLPKIVVALLLITFSFAIAGFLIDIMYLFILIVINILSFGNKYYDTGKVQNEFLNSGIGTLWEYILPYKVPTSFGLNIKPLNFSASKTIDNIWFAREVYLGDALASLMPDWITGTIRLIATIALPLVLGGHFLNWWKSVGFSESLNNLLLVGNGVGGLPGFLIGGPITLLIYTSLVGIVLNGLGFFLGIIILLTLTGMLFNIFFILFRSYLQIMISIIFSPIILLFEAVPGKSTFSYWFKSLIGELITFPLVITMLLIGKIMIMTLSYPGDYWKAPFIGNLNTEGFGVILGAGLIFITPDIIKFVKEALGVKPLPFNIGFGTFLGGAGTVGGGAMGILQQFSTLNMGLSGISTLTGLGKKPVDPKYDPNKAEADQAKAAAAALLAQQKAAANVGNGDVEAINK